MTGWLASVSLRLLAVRGLLVLAGLAVLTGGGYLAASSVPDNLEADAAEPRSYREHVQYWTPEQGQQQALRPISESIEDTNGQLSFVEQLEGPHSPRGNSFRLPVEADYDVPGEPAVDARFPPSLPWEEPREMVHLAVPWETSEGTKVGAIDTFDRLKVVERDGTKLVKYMALEPNQFFVADGTIWYRSAERVAFVEPATGAIVDYEFEEILWREDFDPSFVGQLTRGVTSEREKVWHATVQPTPTASQQLLEDARERRTTILTDAAWTAGAVLVVGQTLVGAGLMARPKRWLVA